MARDAISRRSLERDMIILNSTITIENIMGRKEWFNVKIFGVE